LTKSESNTTGEQTEEDWEAVSQGTHIGIGVNAAGNDADLGLWCFVNSVGFYGQFCGRIEWFVTELKEMVRNGYHICF